MTTELSASAVLDEPSFTLPARPGLLVPEPVDLLADPQPRRLPEGAVSGFAVIGALVAFSCLVGGLTAGLVVIGVSTLLAAIAALVTGRVSLSSVGGQRGAALLLGAAVAALIVPSVTAHQRRAAPEVVAGVPVSSPFTAGTQTAYAAVPVQESAAARPVWVPAPPVQAPPAVPSATAPGLTLALDALDPKPDKPGKPGKHGNAGVGNGAGQGSATSSTTASDNASKAADRAARKSADKAAKASEKAAKTATQTAKKAAKAAKKAVTDAASKTATRWGASAKSVR